MYKIDCIYLMAGSGHRVGLGYPKQYYNLNGKPMFIYGLELLNKNQHINNIIIVTKEAHKIDKTVFNYGIKNVIFRTGGKTRQESVKNGLEDVRTDEVLIMEAVRPFVSSELLQKVINTKGNVVPKSTLKATLVDVEGNCYNREYFGEVQTPQKFNTELLKKAHDKPYINNATDDTLLMWETYGEDYQILITNGEEQNIKITTPLDLIIADAIMKGNKIE